MATLLPPAALQFCDANGNPYAGGTLMTLVPGTTTPKQTWQDAGETVLNGNPVTLDSAGRCTLYGDGQYRTQLYDALGNLVFDKLTNSTVDTVPTAVTVSAAMNGFVNAASLAAAAALLGVRQVATVEQYYSGGGDYGPAFNAAIAALGAAGGGVLYATAPSYNIATTIVMNVSCVRIVGGGRGGNHDSNPILTAGTTLTWTGANGGTLISIAPPASGQRIVGWGVEDVALVSGAFPYTTAAAYGLELASCAFGRAKVTTIDFTTAAVATTGVASLGENSLFQFNDLDIVARQLVTSGTVLQMGGYPGVNNSCFNRVWLAAEYNNGIGIDIQDGDNNTFYAVYLQRASGGTGSPMIMRGGTAASPGYARNNIFVNYSQSVTSGTILSEGAGTYGSRTVVTPAVQNQILYHDTSNSGFNLSEGPGSSFWTGRNTLPAGLSDLYIGASSGYKADIAGLYEIWGTLSNVGGGTANAITWPNGLSLPNGIFIGATASGGNTALFSIAPTGATGMNLYVGAYPGGTASTATWYWRAWGR